MTSNQQKHSLIRTVISILLVALAPLMFTALYLFLGNTIEDGTTNILTMFILTRKVYLASIAIIGILGIVFFIWIARKNYFYLLGILLQAMSTLVAMGFWLVISPKITIADVIKAESVTYYLAIMLPNGNYELILVECVNQQCTIDRLIHTDSDNIVRAEIRHDADCNNHFVAQAFTQTRMIEHAIAVQATNQTCQDE